MNFKDMLNKISQLSEATTKTKSGVKHTADAGGYGRKDDENDEGKKVKGNDPKKKRGGQEKDDGPKFDTPKGDIFGRTSGSAPKGKKGTVVKGKSQSHSDNKKDDGTDVEESKTTKKKGLKEYFDSLDRALNEAEQISIQPAKQNTQVIKQGNNVLGSVTNPQLAQQIKQSIGKGEMTLGGGTTGQQMDEEGDYSAKRARAGADIGKPGKNFGKIAASAGKKYGSKAAGQRVAGAVLANLRKTNEADVPPNDSLMSPIGEGAKPDFLDVDKDKNKKESFKKALQDKKKAKTKVKEGMNHRLQSAHHAGKSHALAKEAYNCRYDDMEEARMYHAGFKEGLDECYGQMPLEENSTTVNDMASFGAHTPELADEGNAFTGALKKTSQGGKFSVGGHTFTDRSSIEESPFAFESLEKQLSALLEGKEEVAEGMTVSISKGQQGSPDSVTVSAQDAEADQLLAAIKQAGLGLFGGDDMGAPQGQQAEPMTVDNGEPAEIGTGGVEIGVVDDHDGMMDLIKKVTGGDSHEGPEHGFGDEEGEEGHGGDNSHDYADEKGDSDEGEEEVSEDNPPDTGATEFAEIDAETAEDNSAASSHGGADDSEEGTCDDCGMNESSCECDHEQVEEQETMDQREEEVAEGWANNVGQDGTEEAATMDPDYMMNTITGGLNKQKVQHKHGYRQGDNPLAMKESIADWIKLAGIK